ncbi:MAG: PA0069 family radical SAM protein [Proteobacteria bacterium]|nr:PA0069 family radical SAM protein [Pseudomonadota bacterium]
MRRPETPKVIKGRGTTAQPANRFAKQCTEAVDDGWERLSAEGGVPWDSRTALPAWFDPEGEAPAHPRTQVSEERARSIISRNDSPDVGFDQSINPFRGCEHGCVYCFARPTHAYLDLSPGLDFETKLYAKTNAAERLRAELAKPGHRVTPIALGINTDAYQPIERRYRITRGLLEVLAQTRHPVSIITKNALVERDLDLLAPMARERLVSVFFSVTTLDNRLAARMEPRASAPHAKLRAMHALHAAGVPVGVMVAPVIPAITDPELESILKAAREAGAGAAGYVLLRLPHELKEIFRDWLAQHFPDRATHVMSLIRQMRGGKDYDAAFGQRMRGEGVFAQLLQRRFQRAHARLGYGRLPTLRCDLFAPPRPPSPQAELF